MDDHRFDGMAKRLGALQSRRGALGFLAALGMSGAVGFFGADAKGKGKGKGKGKKPRCKPKSKPTCSQSACQAAVCDRRRGKWSCRNTCAGTSKPKCLGGQCVDACDEELGLTACGDQCCNPLVHSECCQGTCCPIGQRCKNGQCVKGCEAWGDITGGKLEYEITFWARRDTVFNGIRRRWWADQASTASAELACSYRPGAEANTLVCETVGGTISGTHSFRDETIFNSGSSTRVEQGSGSENLATGPWTDDTTSLRIYLPVSDKYVANYSVNLDTIGVEGTWQESDGRSGTRTFWIPGGDDVDFGTWLENDQPLPATPQTLTGMAEEALWWTVEGTQPNAARATWTFTPDGC